MTASPDFSSSTLTDLQKAHREIERLRAALQEIAIGACEYSDRGCPATYPHERLDWCGACLAGEALAAAPVDGAE